MLSGDITPSPRLPPTGTREVLAGKTIRPERPSDSVPVARWTTASPPGPVLLQFLEKSPRCGWGRTKVSSSRRKPGGQQLSRFRLARGHLPLWRAFASRQRPRRRKMDRRLAAGASRRSGEALLSGFGFLVLLAHGGRSLAGVLRGGSGKFYGGGGSARPLQDRTEGGPRQSGPPSPRWLPRLPFQILTRWAGSAADRSKVRSQIDDTEDR